MEDIESETEVSEAAFAICTLTKRSPNVMLIIVKALVIFLSKLILNIFFIKT